MWMCALRSRRSHSPDRPCTRDRGTDSGVCHWGRSGPGAVDDAARRSVRPRTISQASGSSATRAAIWRQAWRTVVWLRPPKRAPISGDVERQWAPGERRERDRPDEGSLQGADVATHTVGDELEDRVVGRVDVVLEDALAQDRHAHRVVGWADVGHQAGLEARAEAGLERVDVGGQAGRG